MNATVTAIVDIVGKDGREWVKLCFVKENGETGFSIFKKGEIDVSDIETCSLLSPNAVLSFDERGRLTGIARA